MEKRVNLGVAEMTFWCAHLGQKRDWAGFTGGLKCATVGVLEYVCVLLYQQKLK